MVKSQIIFVFFISEIHSLMGKYITYPNSYDISHLKFTSNSAPDGHRCGVCPTYLQKVCAFDMKRNSTFVFDNHCVMDLYNCMSDTVFVPMNYEQCIYFGNFAYVHGFKDEDKDYDEDHIIVKHSPHNEMFTL